MNSVPTISVVLPNYNHSKFIGHALEALLAQESAPDEIIVIDDGSSDDSVRVVEQFAARATTIRLLLNQQNIGAVPTIMRGLGAASGKYIYFAAADDWVMPGFFKLAVDRLEAYPDVGLFFGETLLVDGRSQRRFAVRPAVRPTMYGGRIDASGVRQLLRSSDNWISTGSAIFRRQSVDWAGGLDERLGSFADGFLARKIALTFGFVFEPKIVAAWAVFPDSVSRKTALDYDRAKHMLEAVPALIAADQAFPPWYADAFRDRWRFGTCRLALKRDPIDRTLLFAMGARTPAERGELEKIWALLGRNSARLVTLAWLWYRLRPTTLTGLVRTMLTFRNVRVALALRIGRMRDLWGAPAT